MRRAARHAPGGCATRPAARAWELAGGRCSSSRARRPAASSRAAAAAAAQHAGQQRQQQQQQRQQHQQQQQQQQQLQPARPQLRPQHQPARRLPDAGLLRRVWACGSWLECQQLLSEHGDRLDAMLLSSLVSQSVALSQHGGARRGRPSIRQRDRGVSTTTVTSAYLQQLAELALRCAAGGGFRPQQFANVLWGLARCGHRPAPAWLLRYLDLAELQLVTFQPRHLAQLAWALAALRARPPRRFLGCFLAESLDRLPGFKPIDLAQTLWAMATLRVAAPPEWLAAALAAAERQWAGLKPHELSISLWALAKLGASLAPRRGSAGPLACGLDESGLGGLLAAVARQLPAMGPQEAANLTWGLAVGRAPLEPRQVQALAHHALLILCQAPARGAAAEALAITVWALARLGWEPGLQPAGLLARLLAEAAAASDLSLRQACLLLWSLARLRLAPPPAVMQALLEQIAADLEAAAPADAVQALVACRRLGWLPGARWWRPFYARSLQAGVLADASAAELALLLGCAAGLRAARPPEAWWTALWETLGVELEAALQARGLARVCRQRNLPRRPAGGAGDASSAAQPAPDDWRARRAQATARALASVAALQQASAAAPAGAAADAAAFTAGTAARLLWACARLQLLMPLPLLWQLLLLLLADVFALGAHELATALWALGELLACKGAAALQNHRMLKPLALAARWRLLAGQLGARGSTERRRCTVALRHFAWRAGVLHLLLPEREAGSAALRAQLAARGLSLSLAAA